MLSTPPAFVLSQDQTLIKKCLIKLISLNINILNLIAKIQRNLLVYLILILCLIFKDHCVAVKQLLYNITSSNPLSILFFQYQFQFIVSFFSFVSCDVFYNTIIICHSLIRYPLLLNLNSIYLVPSQVFTVLLYTIRTAMYMIISICSTDDFMN